MFENFKKIKVKGGCFENETELELFKKDPVTVVYGRNGSGKTTIAKRIAELVMPEEDRNSEFEVSTDDIEIGTGQKEQVFVFDEDFVTDQVRFRKDGIDTIVMLGEAGELDALIEKKTKEKEAVEEKIKGLTALKGEYEDGENTKSPTYHFNQLYNSLRETGGWADCYKEVRGISQKGKVTGELIAEFLKMTEPTDSYEALYERLRRRINEYKQSKGATRIEWYGMVLSYPDSLDGLTALLKKNVDKPELSEREQRLLTFMAAHPQNETRQMVDEEWEFCPLCLRDMKDHDRSTVTATLTRLLNKQADGFKVELTESRNRFAPLVVTLPEFPGDLYQKELNDTRKDLEQLEGLIKTVNDAIGWRELHVYEAMTEPFGAEVEKRYADTLTRCRAKVKDLQKKVSSFNEMVDKRKEQENSILADNLVAARKKHSLALALYQQAETDKKKNSDELNAKIKEKETIEGEINSLTAQKERTDIALDYINNLLSYVFYSDKRIQLVASDNNKKYKLTVNGKPVTPDKISVGERNVLALCYFFATIYSNKEEAKRYNSEYFIVIDDPVSSFDYGNRLGVMTLLRYQVDCILHGNEKSRILVMSHDLYSIFDLVKVKNDVCGRSKDQKEEPKGYMALENCTLKPATMRNEYGVLMNHVFEYVKDKEEKEGEEEKDEQVENGIGNVMRKLLEGFSSFCYNKNFMEMLHVKDLLDNITPENKRTYYDNFMFRLALNSESHLEEQTYSLNNMTKLFTEDEKVKTAKSLLLLLMYINRPHVASYLGEDNMKVIAGWQKDEEEWIKRDGKS